MVGSARDDRLPAVQPTYGPYQILINRMHELTIKGHHPEALRAAGVLELMVRAVGDTRGLGFVLQTRMYALVGLGRLQEALAPGLLRLQRAAGATVDEAKALADVAEVLIRLGRLPSRQQGPGGR
jgi:hypothetical protein